jgi:hypothetical protein
MQSMTKLWEVAAVEREGRAVRLTVKNISRGPAVFLMNPPSLYHVPYQERYGVTASALTPLQTNPGESVIIEFTLGREPERYRKTSRIRLTVLDGAGFKADIVVHIQG